ncbi:MAG: hypothetical protein COV72_08430 [Candidatus Omnitrophica bacterium CG11_big_fil_rev_8_21_14_0_20_42_13]|uniref:diguanylate cyclase n=1 Tax=Candidatus Ghiorseimicrobium undicola TaxID=1974746 RepID=A0A2H0LV75_9BACT|nr:MAG: hypothetical protein COV72_08430 [Candidatus Omnitrophica bacterium CG11_big_fil_rev_8_21_14_0_20_42_13]
MFFLIAVIILSLVVILQVREAGRNFSLRQNAEFEKYRNEYNTMLDKLKSIRSQSLLLEEEYRNVTTLYKVVKDISKTLDKNKIFIIFKNILKSVLGIAECLLLNREELEKIDNCYFVFPLSLENQGMEALAVKGLEGGNKDKFKILANQFALVRKRAELYQVMQELSITDNLTQVLVKRHCLERLKEEVLRCRHNNLFLSCVMIDVDNFKEYNDRLGHLIGDVVLVAVSSVIKENIRSIDLLGRFGGEEFILILPETDKQAALFAAERIRRAVEDNVIKAYDTVLRATISIGITSFPIDAQSDKDLMDKADRALYEAKNLGKNRVCLYSVK